MKKEKYVFNQNTLQYEEDTTPTKQKVIRLFGFASAVVLTSIGIFAIAWMFLPSPKERALQRELSQMEYHYSNMTSDYESMSEQLAQLHEKDSEIHRTIFQMDVIDENIWEGGIGGHDKYAGLTAYQNSGSLIKETLQKVDKIKRKINLQSSSLDSIQYMSKVWEEKLASIPSIKPVKETKLKRNIRYLSGFGYRIHPIHKIKKFHYGIDFTAPRGTAVQATGNGTVVKVKKIKTGYGNSVTVDHGYGYTTLYAHMKDVIVKKGQKVKRGQSLGTVGSTGSSTAPHLHYEVKINGKAINPIDFCLDGLTPEEYSQLVLKAGMENQSLD